jgi:hypothetical protein
MSEPVTEATDSKKRAATRSPSYPYVDLKTALAKAEAFRLKEGRNSASFEVAAHHFGYKPKSSGGKQTLGALRAFGLMEPEGPVKLTEDALRVLLDKREVSPERDALLRKMALLPPMHKRLWDLYHAELPSDGNLEHWLIFQAGFNENVVADFVQEYKATIEYAGLKESGSMPPEGEEPEKTPTGGTTMELPASATPRGPNPPPPPPPAATPLAPKAGGGGLLPVTFPLPGDNSLEIRLRSKMSKADFERLKPILIALLEMSVVETEPS